MDQSDILLLVLDAGDPEGYRSRLLVVEEEVRRRESEGKKLVFFVLNKIGKFYSKLPVSFSCSRWFI